MSEKGKMLKNMNDYVVEHVQNEDLFMSWLVYVPDEASDIDFEEISADQDSWVEVLEVFADIIINDASTNSAINLL